MKKSKFIVPIIAVGAVGAVLGVAALGTFATASATDPEPRSNASASGKILEGSAMPDQVETAAKKFDYLNYPSGEAKAAALKRLAGLDFGGEVRWESGIEENIVLDNWQCTWLEHAAAAAESNDAKELIRAGEAIKGRADIPGQREEKFPDVDQFIADFIDPLARGDWAPVNEIYKGSCSDYLTIGATR